MVNNQNSYIKIYVPPQTNYAEKHAKTSYN